MIELVIVFCFGFVAGRVYSHLNRRRRIRRAAYELLPWK